MITSPAGTKLKIEYSILNIQYSIFNDPKRPAATLVEVLIAIFCVSVGMISVLVLFPAGLQNMAEAVRENRIAQAAANAEAIADWANIRADTEVRSASSIGQSPFVFVDPVGADNMGINTAMAADFPEDPNDEKYFSNPRYLGRKKATHVNEKVTVNDPTDPANNTTIAVTRTTTYTGIPRCTVNIGSAMQTAPVRFLSLEDDLTFGVNGQPTITATQVERERRYSWAYLWRSSADPRIADLTVIIYSGRKLRLTGSGTDQLTNEYTFRGPRTTLTADANETEASTPVGKVFTAGLTVATVGWGVKDLAPPIKRGQWVFDASIGAVSATTQMTNGYFYKIEGVSAIQQVPPTGPALGYQQQIILDRPARADGMIAVFMPDVVAVIEKSSGKMPR